MNKIDIVMNGMNFRHIVLSSILLTLATSCSNRALYETVQRNNIQRCRELPIPQQAACEAQYQTSFDDYSKQRGELDVADQP